jgi:RNA polymerase sigma-70 factor (ECF subfamily)
VQRIFCGDTALASDATQEIFIKVWEKLDTFRNESEYPWIWIAVNLPSLFKKIIYKEIRTDILPQVVAETYSSEKMSNLDKCQCIQKLKKRTR